MKIRITLFTLLIILTLLTAQYGLAAGPGQQSAATATPAPTPGGDESEAEKAHAEPTAGKKVVMAEPGQPFQVAVATYLLDTAGLHDIDERLNGEGLIDPGDAGMVNRVNQLLVATRWPEGLQGQVGSLQTTLVTYAEALADDNLEAAKLLATQAHEQQHDLSHAVEQWLGDIAGGVSSLSLQEQQFQVTVVTYLMDTAGFHEMDERLNGEGLIEPDDAGVVNQINKLLAVTAWPVSLHAQVGSLRDSLSQYAEALANDDLEAAKPLSTQVHELQHDLSHAIEDWLNGSPETHDHAADEPAEEHDENVEGSD